MLQEFDASIRKNERQMQARLQLKTERLKA